jgi:hypothetical protein
MEATVSGHTPGPWIPHNIGLGPKGKGPYTFPLGTDPDIAVANARLIAAAPELLEACKLAFARWRPGDIRKDFAGHVAYAALGKAISKAEGRDDV